MKNKTISHIILATTCTTLSGAAVADTYKNN